MIFVTIAARGGWKQIYKVVDFLSQSVHNAHRSRIIQDFDQDASPTWKQLKSPKLGVGPPNHL